MCPLSQLVQHTRALPEAVVASDFCTTATHFSTYCLLLTCYNSSRNQSLTLLRACDTRCVLFDSSCFFASSALTPEPSPKVCHTPKPAPHLLCFLSFASRSENLPTPANRRVMLLYLTLSPAHLRWSSWIESVCSRALRLKIGI